MTISRGIINRAPKYQPSDFMPEILERLRKGEFLAVICRSKGFPSCETVYKWLNADASLGKDFARARDAGYDDLAVQALDVARRAKSDMVAVQSDRLQVDTILRLLAKWHPSRYGDKVEVAATHTHKLSPLEELRTIEQARKPRGEVASLPTKLPKLASPASTLKGVVEVEAVEAAVAVVSSQRANHNTAMDSDEIEDDCF